MRVSFDIDDTLVPGAGLPAEWLVPWPLRGLFPEPMRPGSRQLLRTLVSLGHQVWVYTTSYRPRWYIHVWFRALGVPLGGVVNQFVHERVVGRQGPSKRPSAFGIDLHVDDSDGVRMEGERHGFTVLVVPPDDDGWADRVLKAVGGPGEPGGR